MQFETRKEGRVTVIRYLEERLDERRAWNFSRDIGRLIEQGNTWLVVDISEVNMIDYAGLGALIAIWKRLRENGNIVISGAKLVVKSMFQVTRAEVVFPMFPTEQEAVNALLTA